MRRLTVFRYGSRIENQNKMYKQTLETRIHSHTGIIILSFLGAIGHQ